jgi:hypothetical protein
VSLSDWSEIRGLAFHLAGTVYAALYAGSPGEAGTGGAELTGVGFARQPIVFPASTTGTVANPADIVWGPVPSTRANATYGALFDALTGGHLIWSGALFDPTYAAAVGTVAAATDKVTAAAHGLSNGDTVHLDTVLGAAGLTRGLFFVVNKSTNDFQLATTVGGSAINITTDGAVGFRRARAATCAIDDVVRLVAGQLTVSLD